MISERSEDDITAIATCAAEVHTVTPQSIFLATNNTVTFSKKASTAPIEMAGSLGTTALPFWPALLFTYLEPGKLTHDQAARPQQT